jgi:carboxylesterase
LRVIALGINYNEGAVSLALNVRSSSTSKSGIFAARDYAAGETVHMMDGRRLSTLRCTAEIATFQIRFANLLQISDHTYIALDDVSIRFNHSCDPNSAIRGEREVFALYPIKEGAEVTFDYALTLRPRFYTRQWHTPCTCGAKNCRGVIGDIYTVPAGVRQSFVDRHAVQDYLVRWLYRSPWNRTSFGPAAAPPPPAKDHSIFIPGGKVGVLLIHGLSGTPVEMREIGEQMAALGHTVHCPQLAGHCGTYEDLKAVRWHDWFANVEAGLRRLRETCDTVVVGGLSTGAILSLNIAARYPDLVQGVVALAPTLWLNGWMVPYHAYLFNIVLQKPIANQFDFPDLFPHGVKDETIRHRIKSAIDSGDSSIAGLAVTPGGAVLEHRWLVNATRRDLKWIKQPVMIIHPREDDYADLNNVAALMRNIGGAVETITLEDSYHIVTVDRQKHVVAERMAGFVSRIAKSHAKVTSSSVSEEAAREPQRQADAGKNVAILDEPSSFAAQKPLDLKLAAGRRSA